MEALIIRHAQSKNNARVCESLDSELTDKGIAQATQTADWLAKNYDFSDSIALTSPFHRTLQTSLPIAEKNGLNFMVHGGLREYHCKKTPELLQNGGLAIPKREFTTITWPETHWKSGKVFFKNEELPDFFDRMRLFISTLEPDGKYVFVGHGASCRTLATLLIDGDLEPLKTRYTDASFEFDAVHNQSTAIRNSSLTLVRNGELVWFSKVVYDDISDVA
jgi:broad specificity phosphatase PhoE